MKPTVQPPHHKEMGNRHRANSHAIHVASRRGRVDILQWWKANGLVLEYDKVAIEVACLNGKTGVLGWWKDRPCTSSHTNQSVPPNIICVHLRQPFNRVALHSIGTFEGFQKETSNKASNTYNLAGPRNQTF
ncbi:hypothetical protein DFJ73DRAFT_863545 [Zopfochytrium polystomum]|nr:hypothetical protein DFJ73DRAFT_863545 [Zopfochytrium polystomum]